MSRIRIAATLTPEERAFVIEWALSNVAERWVEEVGRGAPDLAAAIREVRRQTAWSGWSGPAFRIRGLPDGIHVDELPSGHTGRVSYREVAQAARRGEMAPMQLAMELTA